MNTIVAIAETFVVSALCVSLGVFCIAILILFIVMMWKDMK